MLAAKSALHVFLQLPIFGDERGFVDELEKRIAIK